MKMRATIVITAVLSGLLSAGCGKPQSPVLPERSEVVFSAGGPAFSSSVSTKTTAVTSLPSFYAGCTTGTAGNESSVWSSSTFTGSGSPMVYKGDRWWPVTDPSYHFYASNIPMAFTPDGLTVSASTSTDVICAYLPDPTYKVRNTLLFRHVFSRITLVSVAAAPDYELRSVTLSVTPKVSGTYNLRLGAGKTDGTGWSGLSEGVPVTLASRSVIQKGTTVQDTADLYLIPGEYAVSAVWTAVRGNYTETFEKQTDISVQAGMTNELSTILTGLAKQLSISVTVSEWTEEEKNAELNFE